MTSNETYRNPAHDLEKYDGARRRSSALEAKGFPTISAQTDDADTDNAILLQRQRVKRIFGYPITIPFIISNEFCERFSYYGMRTVLMIYLTDKVMMSDGEATDWYHVFIALCYATPLIGALIADIFIGKFLTILFLSMVYCGGNAVMAISSVGKWFTADTVTDPLTDVTNYVPMRWGPLLGLFLIALGTGGIKPCVSSFGGDQFMTSESGRIQRYFSMFYFSINAGSTIATLLTPELRSASCMGEDTCFPLAFGVPAIFMVIALVAFLLASAWYVKVPPLGNPIVDVVKVTASMITGSNEGNTDPKWLRKVSETKQLFRVLVIFIPFPFFWALFEQQGSRWIVQAKRMNGQVGSFTIKPDQMQVFNPLLILILIPIFEIVIYPLMRKIGLPSSAIFRMITGMVLVATSFVICGFVELSMEERVASWNAAHPNDVALTLETFENKNQLHILSTLPQIFCITCGEILCSITGLEFAYAYAPPSMKSVCQSFFLLTNAFGNIITIIVTKFSDRDLVMYFICAGIEVGAALLMFGLSRLVQGNLEKYKLENAKEETKDGDMELEDKKS